MVTDVIDYLTAHHSTYEEDPWLPPGGRPEGAAVCITMVGRLYPGERMVGEKLASAERKMRGQMAVTASVEQKALRPIGELEHAYPTMDDLPAHMRPKIMAMLRAHARDRQRVTIVMAWQFAALADQ